MPSVQGKKHMIAYLCIQKERRGTKYIHGKKDAHTPTILMAQCNVGRKIEWIFSLAD